MRFVHFSGSAAVAGIGIALTLVVTAAIGFLQQTRNESDHKERLSRLTNEFTALVADRFNLYQYGLRAARGTIVAGGRLDISRPAFEEYFASRDQFLEFPGARGIGLIVRVPNGRTDQFIADARMDGFPEFRLRELSPNTGERFLIKYIYPQEGNEGATGLDIASESNRRTAALKAARSGEARLTAPITLVQASGQTNHGFLILLPVYRAGKVPEAPDQREAAAIGWSYSPLVVSEILKDQGPRRDEVAFSITDTGDGTEFYRSAGFNPDTGPWMAREVEVFGRHWRLQFHALPAFNARYGGVKPGILALAAALLGVFATAAAFSFARNLAQKQQAQREEEALAYKIVDTAPQALLVVDESGTIIRANAYSAETFGWPIEEMLGRKVEELVPPARRDGHKELRESYDYQPRAMGDRRELEALRSDGTTFPVIARLAPLFIGSRKLVVAGITDVSAERDAIKVLAASEQRWQEVANSLPQLIWTCDADGTCDFLSQQWIDYTGIPAESQVGAGWLNQVHPDDRDQLVATWTRSVSTTTSFSAEFRIRRHDGQYHYFYTRGAPIRDADGKVVRWIGSNTDIEDRYQAELQVRTLLHEMEDRVAERTAELDTALRDLRNVLDAVPSMIAYWDLDQRNRFANEAYKEWFGVTPEWIKGRRLNELLPEDRYEESLPYVQAALRGEPQIFERELTDAKGKTRSVQVHYLPDVADGRILGFYVVGFDVTAIKASEIAQKQAREAAEHATRAKSAFLTSMSHELRTPMNSILGFTDILISQHFGKLNEKQLEHAGLIKRSGQHLLNLMDSVLELSKIEAGRITISIEPVNVVATIKSVIATLEPLADKYGVDIRAPHLGRGDEYVNADATRLTQVLINLGSNAIKYNSEGGWVEFSCDKAGDRTTRITVSDNGRGIPEERQVDAFQPFNRLGAEQGNVEGSGIGLALVRNYVELMGGRIDFDSTEGEGSRFWVDLHAVDADAVKAASSAHPGVEVSVRPFNGHMKVLYVEDNEINRMLFKDFMTMIDNVEFLEAEDGITGLALAREERPDVIFLDIDLPGMSGYDVLSEIKADPGMNQVPVIALSANAMSGDAERGLKAGFDKYLSKPFNLEQILAAVTEQRDRLERLSTRTSAKR